MEIVKVEIRKRANYEDYANEIAGVVQLQGINGKQEVKLSALVVSQIFGLLKNDLVQRAKALSNEVQGAAENAIHAPLLESNAVIEHQI